MKIRTGFVSNSSSSSFMCQVCNNVIDDYNCENQIRCENDHVVCNSCGEDYDLIADKYGEQVIPKDQCPLCTKKVIPTDDKLSCLCNMLGVTEETLDEVIRGNKNINELFRMYSNSNK